MMVKICGITNLDDARAAAAHGATAVGFNFYPKSPRYIAPERAAEIAAALPPPVWKAGVFVNESPERVAEIARRAGLDILQLHGTENPSEFQFGLRVWKAFRVGAAFDPGPAASLPVEALLLDGPAGALYGGSGQTFDWSRAAGLAPKIVVAGGLDASNVRLAIQTARPWGVDACSKIEASPGIKDHRRMVAFLEAALTC
jgi:phosphoribosylanthranilate isomerase